METAQPQTSSGLPVPPQIPTREVEVRIHKKLRMLFDMHPYKIAYGGRNSLKSWSFARALLILANAQELRILCAREVQKSIAESVHQLLKDQIEAMGLGADFEVLETEIRGLKKGSLIKFTGLSDHTAESIKSFEGFDIAWVEEAQKVKKRSWQILLPTIFRTKNSEVWVTFNPDMDTDETWERFIVNPPPGAKVVEMNYRDAIAAGWWQDEQEKLRQYDLKHAPLDYENIWEGKPRTVVAGAVYSTEVIDMIKDGRFRPIPYDPRLPVHRVWDLGWNDLMTVVMVQKPLPSVLNVINYIEDSHITYAQLLEVMGQLKYAWGIDWLPHDAEQHDPKSGTNAIKLLKGLGCRVKVIGRSDPEARIRAGRMMFPRIYMDNSKRETPPDRPDRQLGAAHLLERLKRYKRAIPKSTNEPAQPVHDINSHGADAFGGLAEIVDQIRNENYTPDVVLSGFSNADQSMGMLG